MGAAMAALAGGCAAIGLGGPFALLLTAPAVSVLAPAAALPAVPAAWLDALPRIAGASALLVLLAAAAALLRLLLLRRRAVRQAVTWDCGYVKPTARMQYTSSSFAQPITLFFRGLLGTRRTFSRPEGLFPKDSSFASETPDFYREAMYRPLFARMDVLLSKFRWLQHGRLNLYVLCVVLALVALLVWKLR
jgi:hypothetical protein